MQLYRQTKLKALLYFVFLFIWNYCSSRAQTNLPQITQSDIPGATILPSEHYNGNSLWGYIDGGADIYLEYGFTKVQVQKIEWQQHHFKIEIYMMKDAKAAFGIYSVSHKKCSASDSLSQFNCITPHQIQIAHGKLYIKIANDEGSVEEQSISIRIAKMIIGKTNEVVFKPPALLINKIYLPYLNELKFFKGPLGIQNGLQAWDDLFEGMKSYSLFFLPLEIDSGSIYISQIQFSCEADKNLFYKKLNIISRGEKYWHTSIGGTFKAVNELSATKIYYIESTLQRAVLGLYLKPIQNY